MFRNLFRIACFWRKAHVPVYLYWARRAGVLVLAAVCNTLFACLLSAAENPVPPDASTNVMALSLDQLLEVNVDKVYGASKFEQKVTEAPSSVSIVTQEDIKQFGYRTLGELLRGVRGFYVTYDRSYNFVGVRGIDRPGDFGGRVLINVDGHRLNEPVYDSAFTDTEFLLDMDLVDRVEVIRGPDSSLYGNNAFFTVVNVITRRGAAVNGAEVSGAAGSFDAYSGRVTYGNKFTNGVELLVSGTYFLSDGHDRLFFPEYLSVNNGIAENLDGTETKSGFLSLAYGDFTLEGGYMDRRKYSGAAQYAPYTVFNDPRFLNEDERAYAELKFNHEFACDWLVQARAYYDHYSFNGTYPVNNNAPDPGPTTINLDQNQAEWVGGELMVSKTLWERQHLTFGGEARDDFLIQAHNFDVDPPLTYLDSHRYPYSFALYAQDEIAVCTNLTVNAGVRYDYFSTFGDTVNPRTAVIYNPWTAGTFKFIYGRAFRAPNAYELYYIQPAYKANPDLQPETIRSFELVYEQGLPANLRLTGSLFLNEIDGLISQTVDPNDGKNFFANLDNVEARGVEAELEGRWKGGLRTRLSYTFTEARDTSTDMILNNSPKHLGKASVVLPLWREKIFAGLEFQAMSSRTTVQENKLGGFTVANATLYSRDLLKNLEFSASLYNLFGTKYSDPVSPDYLQDAIRQDGRTFRLKLTYHY